MHQQISFFGPRTTGSSVEQLIKTNAYHLHVVINLKRKTFIILQTFIRGYGFIGEHRSSIDPISVSKTPYSPTTELHRIISEAAIFV